MGLQRLPYFCSGCPHNSSTKVPDGSRAMAGIGCHGMALWMPSRRTATITHMGAEGANWIGQAPFTDEPHIIDATGIASALMGDSIATNAFMLGLAFQTGALPLSLEAILRAIELNGAAIEMNKIAFSWGRLAAHDIARVRSVLQFRSRAATSGRKLEDAIAYRADFLAAYQNRAYRDRYLAFASKVRDAEAKAAPGSNELTEAVAKNLFKLMAYKDEYEVARLYTDGSFAKKLGEKFEGDIRLKFHLAAPLFSRRDKTTGHLQKREYGGWMIHVFRRFAGLKFLRGTAFDPFGYTKARKTERRLIEEYRR